MAKKETKPSMTPANYREFLRQVELETIFLDTCSVKTKRDNIGSNMKLDIRRNVDYKIEEETSAVITSSYDLTATKTTKKNFALKVTCVYRVLLSSKRPITDEFMEIFTNVNIQMNTWPYFREFVQSMIQRVGFPPLTLPFLKQ
ncbi:MAG: protein-export chaperone SecB [Deltaproteobacteria bacterium]|nr:protein-export chaperone SecB [Deltaproteobacteria bacterium]MBW2011620.1 protein-export chaperone SecB [Deltaproteobacteria bacterium]MBW2100723.1 protein-export chaperone SecB [Deltaproteobacteria bacterium]